MDYNREIKRKLEELAEEKYRDFNSGLIPDCGVMYGVRLPALRDMAKKLAKGDWRSYLAAASDDSYEETMLQGLTIAYVKGEIDTILPHIRNFVPKIKNWAVCDSFCNTLKITKKHPEEMWALLEEYKVSEREFELRFVLVMYLNYYLRDEKEKAKPGSHITEVLRFIEEVNHPGYYVKMASAWALAEAYLYAPRQVEELLIAGKLDVFTRNKAIQKMRESYRLTEEDKEKLQKLKK